MEITLLSRAAVEVAIRENQFLVAGDLADALARLKNDVATGLIAKQFGDAYVADWWNSSETVLASAARSARYVSEQGPACLAIRSREAFVGEPPRRGEILRHRPAGHEPAPRSDRRDDDRGGSARRGY
jgi:hypothetical protein